MKWLLSFRGSYAHKRPDGSLSRNAPDDFLWLIDRHPAVRYGAESGGGLFGDYATIGGWVMVELSGIQCACGCADLIAVAPGDEEDSVDLLGTKLLIRVGMPLRAWCVSCWPCAVAVAEVVP